ncbi:hypothetical protein BLNAU_2194 [Blattamonas nauphoetae]|uniref:Uncharacterized protein n=1 Tax=Blattamonas nauphoetae TaxID=2049346 RepID=A0ABQ9YG73_9EUKA|nr:hypothetical protein BLNAU_2194 [Blattamonas nauphoetae]
MPDFPRDPPLPDEAVGCWLSQQRVSPHNEIHRIPPPHSRSRNNSTLPVALLALLPPPPLVEDSPEAEAIHNWPQRPSLLDVPQPIRRDHLDSPVHPPLLVAARYRCCFRIQVWSQETLRYGRCEHNPVDL